MTHYQTLHAHTFSFWTQVLGLSVIVHVLGIALWINTDSNDSHSLEITSHFNVVLETQQQKSKPAISTNKTRSEPSPVKKTIKDIIKEKIVKVRRQAKLKSAAVAKPTNPLTKSLAKNKPEEDDKTNQQEQFAYASPRVATEFNNRKPYYPQAARRREMQGTVLLMVKVGLHGEVLEVVIKKSSGYHLLDDAAKETIEQWKFQPARRGSKFETGSIEIPVRFNLRESG